MYLCLEYKLWGKIPNLIIKDWSRIVGINASYLLRSLSSTLPPPSCLCATNMNVIVTQHSEAHQVSQRFLPVQPTHWCHVKYVCFYVTWWEPSFPPHILVVASIDTGHYIEPHVVALSYFSRDRWQCCYNVYRNLQRNWIFSDKSSKWKSSPQQRLQDKKYLRDDHLLILSLFPLEDKLWIALGKV